MKPYYQDTHVTIHNDSCLNMDIPDESVQCVVTSPPYWGLRKYSGEQELVWEDPQRKWAEKVGRKAKDCEHEWIDRIEHFHKGQVPDQKWTNNNSVAEAGQVKNGCTCRLCGAWRGSFGLEPTPEMYVAHTVEILREIRRVLRKDGVVFWNIGDSYTGSGVHSGGSDKQRSNNGAVNTYIQPKTGDTLKPKDLCLIPFRVAIAAQEDGWWVRSVIIWSKPNPMPESVQDRPTESHEYILMLTKSAKYYWDIDAVREALRYPDRIYNPDVSQHKTKPLKDNGNRTTGGLHDGRTQYTNPNGRNLRSVWEFPTQPYPEAHFAVFPEALPKKCIMAASKEGDTILDPFAGSGTVGKVAKSLGRKAILYDLSSEYCAMAKKRVSGVSVPMF